MTSAPHRFVMLMPWGRVGSNLLFTLLHASFARDEVRFANEWLNATPDAEEQLAWFRDFYAAREEGLLLVGSKHALRGIADPKALAGLFAELELPLVRMRRANLVKVTVSKLRADLYAEQTRRETGAALWGVEQGREALPPEPLDPARFVDILAQVAHWDRELAKFAPDCPTLDIEYGELQADPLAALHRTLDWIGIAPRREAKPRYRKATPDELARAVPNLAELRDAAKAAGLDDLDAQFEE